MLLSNSLCCGSRIFQESRVTDFACGAWGKNGILADKAVHCVAGGGHVAVVARLWAGRRQKGPEVFRGGFGRFSGLCRVTGYLVMCGLFRLWRIVIFVAGFLLRP